MSRTQLCTFQVGSLFLGIEVRHVQEVLREQQMTRVPLAPSAIAGLINLRGQIVAALDLRECLQLDKRPADKSPMNVVVYTGDGAVSLVVDEVGDVVEVMHSEFEPAPQTIVGPALEIVEGVYKLDDRLLLVLNIERTTSLACQVSTGVDTRNGRIISASA